MPAHPLERFYYLILPRFSPRAEEILQHIDTKDLQNLNFRYVFTVGGMIEISHLIENFVIQNPQVADLHVSFQYFSRFTPQAGRYRKVAESAKGLWLYGVNDALLPELPRVTVIDTSNSRLVDYWFVIAYGPGVHMSLLAEELYPSERLPGEERVYEGFYTFDPVIAFQLVNLMHQLYPQQVPSPIPPDLFES